MRAPAIARAVRRTRAVAAKEVRHILRDVRVLYLSLGLPVVLLFIFGYAVSFDIDRLPLAIVDQDHTQASRELVEAMTANGVFSAELALDDPARVPEVFRRGQVKAALVIPDGYQRALRRREDAPVQLLLDGADGTTSQLAAGFAAGVVEAHTERLLAAAGARVQMPFDARVRVHFNPGARSALPIVPGLIALLLAILATLLTALTVAREWERGSMEQLFATPVGRLEIVLGKLLPYAVLGVLQALLVLALGTTLFDVPIRGSFALLMGFSLLFLLGMLGQGLLISIATKNQQVAVQAGVLSSMLPASLLSGFLSPVENMPPALQAISSLVPARYFIVALRGILLKGTGLDVLWPEALALAAFAAVILALSAARFRRGLG